MLTLSTLSLEYVRVLVSATSSGSAVNPTSDTVTMAFVAEGTAPVSGDFKAATWETDSTTTPATYFARCLIGPTGTLALTAGIYDAYVKVTDSPEVPVHKAGQIRVI